jgi:antitoxin (DNA-binding transcriptional repressor) of toxin-antitoxin stability system
MKTMTVAEVKTNFSAVLTAVQAGEKIAITYGRKKEIKALLIPNNLKQPKRKLGVLEGKANFTIKKGYKITEQELLGL